MMLIAKRSILLALLLPLAGGVGCRNVWKDDSPAPVVQAAPERTRIVYRTRTDRLNVAGAKLPACSIATLHIEAPHPDLKMDIARATVVIEPCTADASPFPSRGLSGAISSFMADDASAASALPASTWTADVPLWQVQTIVAALEKAKFFDRQRTVLSPEVFLSLEAGPQGVGKKYRAVDELDVLLLRVVDEEAAPTSTPIATRAVLSRLPAL